METIWERTKDALDTLTGSIPFSEGKLQIATGEKLPDVFITYKLVDAPPEQYADDEEKMRTWKMQVSIFSRNGLISLPNVDGAMTAAGFTKGNITELPYNTETGHYGLATEYLYFESEE